MKILVFIISVILLWVFTPVFVVYAMVRYVFNIKVLGDYFYSIAFAIDQLGNVMGAPIMNDLLLKKESTYKYGNPDQTISHVTGVNYKNKTLTVGGYFLAHVLDEVDKNHVEKAAETDQRN